MRVCVVIPTYNEAKTISDLVKGIRGAGLDMVVVDDGSTDDTAAIAEESAVAVLRNTRNQGKGASLARGFDYAIKSGFDAVITMDGDGQHLASDLPLFLRVAVNSEAGMIVGNRMLKTKKMPVLRYLTNKFMSWMISGMIAQRVPDTQCGFRLIKCDLLKKMNLSAAKFEVESEMLFRAAGEGFKITSVPVHTVYAHEKSHINPFTDTIRFFKFILRELWTRRS